MPLQQSDFYYVGNFYGTADLNRDAVNKLLTDLGADARLGPALDEETGAYYPATEVLGVYRTLSVGVVPRFGVTLEQALAMESDAEPSTSEVPLSSSGN